jgi:hypothetical protein
LVKRKKGLVHGSHSARRIKPAITGALFTTILKQQARQAQSRKEWGSTERGKGVKQALSMEENKNVVIKRKKIDSFLLMERGSG